jgi:hypothetical protein
MSHHLFKANCLDHGDDFLPEPSTGTERQRKPKPNPPSQTARHSIVDGECNWSGYDPSRDDKNIIHPTRQHFNRCNTNATDPSVPTTSDPPPLIAEEEVGPTTHFFHAESCTAEGNVLGTTMTIGTRMMVSTTMTVNSHNKNNGLSIHPLGHPHEKSLVT